jgi:hypothetical protein
MHVDIRMPHYAVAVPLLQCHYCAPDAVPFHNVPDFQTTPEAPGHSSSSSSSTTMPVHVQRKGAKRRVRCVSHPWSSPGPASTAHATASAATTLLLLMLLLLQV